MYMIYQWEETYTWDLWDEHPELPAVLVKTPGTRALTLLSQVVQECKQAASDLHQKARDAALHSSGPGEVDVLELFQAADRAEQDVQLKTQLVDSLSLASKVEHVTAVQVMWMCKPYLNQASWSHLP